MFDSDTGEHVARPDKYFGKYGGLVLQNGPPEDTDHRGELLVEVPGILEETADGSADQALQVVAKPCFLPGVFFVPDVGAQVWVEFVAGDIDSPVWTGVWYPTNASPQTADGEAPTEFQKVMRTTSGHVIQLDDTQGDEKLVILHKSGSVVTLDKDGNILIEHKDGATGGITLDGAVHITGNTSIDGVLTVGTGPKTTISGNEITGG